MKAIEALEIANKAKETMYEETYKLAFEGIKDAASNGKFMYELTLSLHYFNPDRVIKEFRNLGYAVGMEKKLLNNEYFVTYYIRWDV